MYAGQVKREREPQWGNSQLFTVNEKPACQDVPHSWTNKRGSGSRSSLWHSRNETAQREEQQDGKNRGKRVSLGRFLNFCLPVYSYVTDYSSRCLYPHPSLCRFLWTCCLIHCPFIPVSAAPGRQNEVTEPAWGSRIHTGWLRDPMRGLLIEQKVLQHVVIALMFVWSSVTPWNL